ncbi:enoyl-[acyl-carrier protein] reductase II [Sporomusaceae bacterium BoRhaA]|uniref:nitronate monooxygenase n=1 Tax=Pelorhabdus rhamnosifermentans TaxID=2772457 RepID=UPI001C064145|nr:nitronate monooxygenase [Pelorhabdus rhamnosifermentans]MBU2701571.1 enoyl-[acyl-carrier protein] reductase II [Pelorhabdus rhamnosifermentans]
MQTKLMEILSIHYPILQGAMAWISDGKLAAAVSEAGGAGIIATGGRNAQWVKDQIRLAKSLTNKPFGVNVQLMAPNKDELVAVICEEKVVFVTLGAGNPIPYFKSFQQAGILKIPVVPNAKLAKRVEDEGADAMVIEGMEAGGHIGSITTMALMTQIIPLVRIPVIVAGGIADGRGVAAALVMGAAGVQIGTRFLLAAECAAHDNMKQKLIEAVDTDSVITGYSIGHSVRGLKNPFTEKFIALEKTHALQEDLEKLATGTNRLAAVDGDVVNGMMQAGQSLLGLKKIEPADQIVKNLMEEAKEVLAGAGNLL